MLESRWGLAQGFDEYSDRFEPQQVQGRLPGHGPEAGRRGRGRRACAGWTAAQTKFFAWIHLYDPHTPYEPPEPFASRYPGQPYVGEIAYTDKVVGRLLDWLRGAGLLDRTLVVVTGDHGESLGDHGEATHAYFI